MKVAAVLLRRYKSFWTQDDSFALRLDYKQGLLSVRIDEGARRPMSEVDEEADGQEAPKDDR